MNKNPNDWKVRAGNIQYKRLADPTQTKRVKKIRLHRKYNKANDGSHKELNNDIAIFITEPFYMTEYVRPACLPTEDFEITEGYGIISGFGTTEHRGEQNLITVYYIQFIILYILLCQR